MANTKRRKLDNAGNQFMPMNVEGGSWDEHFISTKKLVFIGIIFFSLMFMIMYFADNGTSVSSILICLAVWLFISQLIVRYIVFEEKFYYKMYKVMKNHEITTPAIFWDITSIKDSYDGAILTYSDAKIAIVVKLERDTITGKREDFKEIHYDAISDFYRALMQAKYMFVQMNLMEQAGDDPRLDELGKLVNKSNNKNICELMEKEIGYIKNISHKTLYESDYFIIYTYDVQKIDSIIDEAIECLYKVLDGAYIGYRVLSAKEVVEFVRSLYGVKYFNYTQATLDMFKIAGISGKKPFVISDIRYTDGSEQEIGEYELNKIYKITSDIKQGSLRIEDISIQDALKLKENKNKINGIDLDKELESMSDDVEIYDNSNRISNTIQGMMHRKINKKSDEKMDLNLEDTHDENYDDGESLIDF